MVCTRKDRVSAFVFQHEHAVSALNKLLKTSAAYIHLSKPREVAPVGLLLIWSSRSQEQPTDMSVLTYLLGPQKEMDASKTKAELRWHASPDAGTLC